MTDRYEKIRKALAMGPTPGSREVFDLGMWDVEVRSSDTSGTICQVNNEGTLFRASEDGADRVGRSQGRLLSDAFFIAACDPDTIRALLAERDAQLMPAAIKATIKEALIFRHDAGEDQDACDSALNWLSQHAAPVAAQEEDDAQIAELEADQSQPAAHRRAGGTAAMSGEDIELPPIPKASKMYDIPGYDEEELKDYARAAVLADREQRAHPAPAEGQAEANYAHTVPDECKTLHWRGQILSMNELAALAQQPATHPAITHCDNCGCDWLDNGLNPVGCPYCKQLDTLVAERDQLAAALEAAREDVERTEAENKRLRAAFENLASLRASDIKKKKPYAQGAALGEFGIIPMCDQVNDEPPCNHMIVRKLK